jgi:hypothetical protein
MEYAIWTKSWVLISTWEKLSDAKVELTYLRDMLGLDVSLFKKVA